MVLFYWFPYGSGYGAVLTPIFENLLWLWQNAPEWEHAMFVPVICGALVYLRRHQVAEAPIKPDVRLGGAVLLLGTFAYWIGFQVDIVPLSLLIMHFLLGGLILWFFGWAFFKAIFFPYVFLVFAWPMPFLDSMVAFPLRLIMSEMSHLILNVVGIDNVKVGTAIVSAPNFEKGIEQGERFALDVADPCSGIRSLFALTMVTALYAYFTLKRAWKQWTLFLFAVPLAVMGNMARILMLTFGALLLGSDFAIGTEEDPSVYHMAAGFFVFVVALGGMVGIGWILEEKIQDDLFDSRKDSPGENRNP